MKVIVGIEAHEYPVLLLIFRFSCPEKKDDNACKVVLLGDQDV